MSGDPASVDAQVDAAEGPRAAQPNEVSPATTVPRRTFLKNAGATVLWSIFNIVVGFAFQALLAARLGENRTADVFAAGVTIPTVFATAVLGAVPLVFVPLIARTRSPGSDARIPGRLVRLTGLASAGGCAIVLLFAPLVAFAIAPGFGGQQHAQLADFIRITSPVMPLVTLAAVGQSIAYANSKFGRAAAAACINGCALLASATAFALCGPISSRGLAIAITLGYVAQLLWMLPELSQLRGAGLIWDTPRRVTRDAGAALAVLSAASLVYKAQPLIERLLASTLSPGVPAGMNYALKIAQGVAIISAFGLSIVAMPRFSDVLARGDYRQAASMLRWVLTATTGVTLLLAAFVLATAPEIVRLVYGRGDLTLAGERLTSQLLMGYVLWIVAGSIAGPVVNILYAENRQRWIAGVGVLGMIVASLASYLLALAYGGLGVVLGTGIGAIFTLCITGRAITRHLTSWSWRSWTRANVRLWWGISIGFSMAFVPFRLGHVAVPARGDYLALIGLLIIKGLLLVGASAAAAAALGYPLGPLARRIGQAISARKRQVSHATRTAPDGWQS